MVKNLQHQKHVSVLQMKHQYNLTYLKYLYNYLLNNSIICTFNGSTLGWLNKETIKNIKLPVPKDISKIEPLINNLHNTHAELSKIQKEIQNNEKKIQNEIQEICNKYDECDEYKLGDICEYINGKKRNTTERNTTEGTKNDKYPLFSSSLQIDFYMQNYDYNEPSIIFNTINGSGKYNCHYCTKYCVTSKKINLIYLYYFCLLNMKNIEKLALGTTKKKLNKSNMNELKIKVPKSKSTIKKLEKEFDEIEKTKRKSRRN